MGHKIECLCVETKKSCIDAEPSTEDRRAKVENPHVETNGMWIDPRLRFCIWTQGVNLCVEIKWVWIDIKFGVLRQGHESRIFASRHKSYGSIRGWSNFRRCKVEVLCIERSKIWIDIVLCYQVSVLESKI